LVAWKSYGFAASFLFSPLDLQEGESTSTSKTSASALSVVPLQFIVAITISGNFRVLPNLKKVGFEECTMSPGKIKRREMVSKIYYFNGNIKTKQRMIKLFYQK
jgi:hypothetical protein